MRVRPIIVLVLLGLTAWAHADAIDDLVKGEMEKRHVPGVALAVVNKGRVEKVGAYGLANVELGVAVSSKSVFQIQSITKTFTSAAVLKLVEEGKLSLDDAVGKHLKDAPENWKDITLRHLLSHTSGIKDFINEPTASLRIDVSEVEVLKATAPRALNFTPGAKYAYSNTNYHLLAMIIRQITGKSYGEFLKERIFEPLGMKQTRVVSLSDAIPNRAAGYAWENGQLKNGQYVAESILSYGGGGIVSTAEDMAKWAMALDGESVLKRETIEKAWTAATLNDGSKSNYGLGWNVGVVNGHRFVAHGGAHMTGFTSHLIKFRDDGLSIIVLTNARNGNPSRIARMVAGMVIPALAPQAAKAIEDTEPEVTRRVVELIGRFREGRLDEKVFTAKMWETLGPQIKSLSGQVKGNGELKKVERLANGEKGGAKTYKYRAVFAERNWVIDLTFDGQGKIAGLWFEEE